MTETLTLEQHNEVVAGITSIGEWARALPRVEKREAEAVKRSAEAEAYRARCAPFWAGLEAALLDKAVSFNMAAHEVKVVSNSYGCAVAGVDVALTEETTGSYMTRRSTGRLRFVIGDYGDKTQHPEPKAGWRFDDLAERILGRAARGLREKREAAAAAECKSASKIVADRLNADHGGSGWYDTHVTDSVSANPSTSRRDRVHVRVTLTSLTSEEAGRVMAVATEIIAAHKAENEAARQVRLAAAVATVAS